MRIPGTAPLLAAMAALAFAGAASAQKTTLLVYTALETDQLKAYQEGFNKVEPNIELKWVRDSTGVITAKLLAEKANPQADVNALFNQTEAARKIVRREVWQVLEQTDPAVAGTQ